LFQEATHFIGGTNQSIAEYPSASASIQQKRDVDWSFAQRHLVDSLGNPIIQ
jgi:hypothetical protein